MVLYDDPRSAWTSNQPTGRTRISATTRRGIRWHWSGNPTNRTAASPHSSCLTLVAAWERFHMSKGWNSIGYNLLVCPHARVIEGRGVDYRGAHSGSTEDNALTYGVQFMVGTGEVATSAMFDRATRLERELWEHSGRTLSSSGHRDAPDASTECPGSQIYEWAHSPHVITTPPDTEGDDDMPTAEEIAAAIMRYPTGLRYSDKTPVPYLGLIKTMNTRLGATQADLDEVQADVAEILANTEPGQ